jgi:hypothetical protein
MTSVTDFITYNLLNNHINLYISFIHLDASRKRVKVFYCLELSLSVKTDGIVSMLSSRSGGLFLVNYLIKSLAHFSPIS